MKEPAMRSPEERLARLLDRHSEFLPVASDDPTGAIIRRDELLVPARHAAAVEEAARRWTDGRTDVEALGLARFRLRGDADVADLITSQFSPEGGEPLAAPVHMFRGEPNYQGGPGGVPSPVPTSLPAPATASSGHRVTVAILDTGISANHPWFPATSWDAIDKDVDDRLDENNDYELDAQAGHGTFIAGVVRQHAPGAHVLVGRVLGSDGVCDEMDLLRALLRLRDSSAASHHGIGVLNLSLGAYMWNDRPPALVSQAIESLGGDTVVVAAAGNNHNDRAFWPAAFEPVIGVGALRADGTGPTSFSNYGSWVDAWAPGDEVASSFVTFDGPKEKLPGTDIDPDCFTGFAHWSGTSFAAPRVAAELARRAQEEKSSPRDVRDAVLRQFTAPVNAAAVTDGGP
jgi:subtilisin family serine protease